MFSIIIPLYNKESSIYNTIQSVLNQTFRKFEVIVINDGSTDKSYEIVKNFEDSRIKIINQLNKGVSAARNRGIDLAQYEWIAFLDGDDEWYPSKLAEYNVNFSKFPQSNWGFAGYNFFRNGNLKKKILFTSPTSKLENVIESLELGLKIHTSSVVIRKFFLVENNIKFSLGINSSEDREVWIKCACCDKNPVYINKCLSKYNVFDKQESLTLNNKSNSEFHFLSMEKRVSEKTAMLSIDDKTKLKRYLKTYNRQIIYNYWIILTTMPLKFKGHVGRLEYFLLFWTIKFPKFVKKVVIYLFFKIKII